MNFNEKLQKLRKDKKYSQEELADKLDVTRQSVSKWESGQTYPEMDKLLALCKIFECSLEELTNDNITIKDFNSARKNNFHSFIDSILDFINKTYNFFTNITFKEFIKCAFIMFIVLIILLVCSYPLEQIKKVIFMIFDSTGRPVIRDFFYSIFRLLIDIAYYVICVLIFVYIFKIGFLDKKIIIKDVIEEKEIIQNKEKLETKQLEERIIIKKSKEHNFSFFSGLGTVAMFFIKVFLAFIAIPFFATLVFFSFALAIDVYLMFEGIFLIGIFLGLICFIILNGLILEFIFNILFNKHHKFKRMFISLIVFLIGSGIACGILLIEINSYKYINDVPQNLKVNTSTYYFNYEENLYINDYYYYDIKYIEDNTMNNEIKIEVTNYIDFINIYPVKSNNYIYFDNSNSTISLNETTDLIIKDLKNKEVHNYSMLDRVDIKIMASKEVIDQLFAYYNEIEINNYEDRINELENEINLLGERIHDLQNDYSNLEDENNILKSEKEELENKIEEYKDRISKIIE